MNKFSKLSALLIAGLLVTGFAACQEPTDDDRGNVPPVEDVYTAPTVTADPAVVEIYQGGEIDLTFGVSVSDEYDSGLVATIQDDGGFDANVVGEYTITYAATNSKGETGTATRTVKVLAPLANLVLEVQKANDTKWTGGVYMNFAHDKFYTLIEDTTYETYMNGVFYNDSEETIVVDIPGGGAQAAIVDANGTVIEGRDGSNGYLMNKDNPQRVGSKARSFTYNDIEYQVATDFARFMQIPAKGYAIVVTTGMFGEGFDYDGRSFLNKNVVYQYGVAVSLYWEGEADTPLTVYADRGPTVTPPSAIELKKDANTLDEIKTMVLDGITVADDNGTFNVADDVKEGLTIEIVNNGGCDPAVAGTYTFELKVVDANGNATNFNRTVTIIDAAFSDVYFGENKFSCVTEKIAINKDVTAAEVGANLWAFLIYTNEYKGSMLANHGYGIAIVVDADYKVTRIYDGAWNRYFDTTQLTNDAEVTATKLTYTTYMQAAFDSLQKGETLIIAPNCGDNNAAGGSRTFFKGLVDAQANGNGTAVTIGAEFQLAGYTTGELTINTSSVEVKKNTITVDKALNASKVSVAVYTKSYADLSSLTGGWAEAFLLDKFGVVVEIYDGVNAKKFLADGTTPAIEAAQTVALAVEGFNANANAAYLVIAPNGGIGDLRKGIFLSNRTIGAKVEIPGVAFEKTTIAIDGVATEIDRSKLIVNADANDWSKYHFAVYEYSYKANGGGISKANGWGVAIIIEASTGKVLRVYDGVNGKYFDADNKGGVTDATKCTAAAYLAEAYASLGEGETLIAGVNNGQSGANAALNVGRVVMSGYRKIDSIVTMTNVL